MEYRCWFSLLLIAGSFAAGCGQEPGAAPATTWVNVNGYGFGYELVAPLDIRADANSLQITTGTTKIRVSDGKLWVDERPYGAVQLKDQITATGGKVTVNGEVRKPNP
jgi:hypothetical protein